MLKKWLIVIGILSMGYLFPIESRAQSYVQLYDESHTTAITPRFEYLWETNSKLSFPQVLRKQDEFIRSTSANPNFGFSKDGLWLRVYVDNLSERSNYAVTINFSQIDYVDFYLVNSEGQVSESKQGKLQHEQKIRIPSFNFDTEPGEVTELYIRVQSDSSSIVVPTYIQPFELFTLSLQIDSLAWGIFYGGLIILVIYNLALFFTIKQTSVLTYIVYITTVIIWQFIWGGHVQLLFPSGQPSWFGAHTELIFVMISISSGIFTLFFLEAKKNAPKSILAVLFFILLQFVVGLICTFDLLSPILKNKLIYGIGSFAILSYIAAGIEAFLNRFKPALYFIYAWSMLAIGTLVGMLSLIGIFPSNTFTIYCFQVGIFLEACLFSFALMEKNQNQLHGEIEQATDDLRNNMEVIEEQNVRLDIARKDAIKASNIKSQFLANMSHEIRTPLNAILGFGRELEQAGLALNEHEQIKIVNSAAVNLLTIVNDVLDFSKIEAGKLQVNNSPFSPLSVFEEMVAIMAKTAHSKGLDFIFNSCPLPQKIISDEIRLKQVLTNLIGNALKFTHKGSVSLSVSAKQRQHGVIDLLFEVTDTGIGISRTDRQKLFSAFSQVDDSTNRNYQGTGLGLVISQELVRLMNGAIELRSEPGVGTTFSVMVRASQINQRSEFSYLHKVTNINVVLFDACPDSRQATAKMLIALGAKVHSVDSLNYLQTIDHNPDFLLIFLSNRSRYNDKTVIHCALAVKAKARVIWYCDEDPLIHTPVFRTGFINSVSMPATPSRLAQVIAVDSMEKSPKIIVSPLVGTREPSTSEISKLNVLAVDDMAMNLSLLETWFKNTPVSLVKAFSGEEALDYCQRMEFDIILMDVQMPGMDGLQASKEIRKTELNIGTPIIAVTAHAFKEEQDRLLSSGMDDYLPKPVSHEALIDTLKRWCDIESRSEKSNYQVINWQLALERSNNDTAISERMMQEFVSFLPESIDAIEQAAKHSDMKQLGQVIHKLHGASCYTGAPEIQALSEQIEIHIKQIEYTKALALLPKLYTAITHFGREYKALLP